MRYCCPDAAGDVRNEYLQAYDQHGPGPELIQADPDAGSERWSIVGTQARKPPRGRARLGVPETFATHNGWLASGSRKAAKAGGEGWIRTSVRLRGQIYSLLPLTTRPPLQMSTRRPSGGRSSMDSRRAKWPRAVSVSTVWVVAPRFARALRPTYGGRCISSHAPGMA